MSLCKCILGYVVEDNAILIFGFDMNPNDLLRAIDFAENKVLFNYCPKCGKEIPKDLLSNGEER